MEKIHAYDVTIFANPVYFGDLTESMIGFLGRLRTSLRRENSPVAAMIPAVDICYSDGGGNGAPKRVVFNKNLERYLIFLEESQTSRC
ncbi:MAG: hypothetical protein PH343_06460 [Nitrospira sp.]|nr:hypothetical protein [Nitrospira sp.]